MSLQDNFEEDELKRQFEVAERQAARAPTSHTGKTTSYRGPGTYNPLVHTGKMMLDLASGVRQLVGDNDNPFSRKVQDMADTYGKYDQPILGQLGGAALMMLPELAISPMALPATALPFAAATKPFSGARGISQLAKQIGEEAAAKSRLNLVPGMRGGIEGAAYGGASHVNPESETPGMDRAKAAGMGATLGAGLDALTTNAKLSLGTEAAKKARDKISGDLPIPVRLPGPELWNQKSAAARAKNFRESAAEPSWNPGQKTKRLYETGYKRGLRDIEDNADMLREQMTGLKTPVVKGESIKQLVDELKVGREQNKEIASKSMDNFLSDQGNVLNTDATKFYDIANDFSKYVRMNIPGKTPYKLNDITTAVDDMYDKVQGGFLNIKDIERLRRQVRVVMDDTNPAGTTGKAARKLYSNLSDYTDNIKLGEDVFGSPKSFDNYVKAKGDRAAFNDAYNKNLIMQEVSKGELSPNQLSDRLFGAKNMADSAERLDALDTIMQISPTYKKALKREATQQLLSGQSTKGRNFNIDEFLSEYGGSLDTGRGTPIFSKLFDKQELNQFKNLYDVSRQLEQKQLPRKSAGYADTSVTAQALNTNVVPTASNLINAPGLRNAVGKPLEDYLNAIRYGSGRQYAVGDNVMTGKTGGMLGAHSISETTEEMNAPDEETDLDRMLKLLGTLLVN